MRFLADNCQCEGLVTCTYDGEGITPHIPGINCGADEDFDEWNAESYAEFVQRTGWQEPSGGDWVWPKMTEGS